MRAGRLRHRVTFKTRTDDSPPIWSDVATVWAGLKPPESQQNEQTSLRAPRTTEVIIRADGRIKPGQLMILNDSRWYVVEATANLNERGQEQILTCREFIGFSASYQPNAGIAYGCMAWLLRSSAYVGFESAVSENRTRIELLIPQLTYPYARRGDQVFVQGATYTIDAIEKGGDDGMVVQVMVT